jgi:phage tail-like protein
MSASSNQRRAYAAAHFALELDGKQDVGLFKSVEGGGVKTDLVKYQVGGDHKTSFRLGKPKFDDLKVQVGMAMSKPFYEWVSAFFRGKPERKSGAIVAADFYYKERARREFFEAMISEVVFPKLDGADKGGAYMGVTISPERLEYKQPSGAEIKQAERVDKQKLWAACNFGFTLKGFEQACQRVTKVDSFTIKQKPVEHWVGGSRTPVKTPGRIEYPNLVFYLPESESWALVDYHQKRTIRGGVQDPTRLDGQLTTYDNGGAELFTIDLLGCEIFAVTHDKSDASSEEIKQVKVEICVEEMSFAYLAGS